ncbi:hypothetical protein KQH56_03370 [bacterium]|nr:hypothetical protein [bacterium]
MDRSAIEKVCQKVYRRFPSLSSKRPRVSSQSSGRYLLIFSGSGKTPDGKSISQTIRVVADEQGRILKTSTSR